mgnify:CR=1 FL=1
MKIIVSGKNSQIGKELSNIICKSKDDFIFTDSSSLNYNKLNEISTLIEKTKPNFFINLAAYTDVELAEINKDEAFQINANALSVISKACENINTYLIHISTDYVFGKNNNGPFSSLDDTGPVNFYGFSKLAGEEKIISNRKSIIIRTASVFSKYNKNFVKNIADKVLSGNNLEVIEDQKISITYAKDLANFILMLINSIAVSNFSFDKNPKIIHFTNLNYTNWYNVALFIKKELSGYGLADKSVIRSINSSEWNTNVKRSSDTRLSLDSRFLNFIDIELFNWQDRVKEVLKDIVNDI